MKAILAFDNNTSLMPLNDLGIPLVIYDDDAIDVASSSGDYLPRIQLMSGSTTLVKEGKFATNHFAIIKGKQYTDLGESVDLMIVTYRPRAMQIGDEIIVSHDVESEEFKRIKSQSTEQDSGCMFGVEFLVWVPTESAFATLFCNSATFRKEIPVLRAHAGCKMVTLKPHRSQKGKHIWFTPIATTCSTPPTTLPQTDELREEVQKFNNPPEADVKLANDEGLSSRER